MNKLKKAISEAQLKDYLLLSYWIIYLQAFVFLEKANMDFTVIESPIDSLIPFIPAFVYPYLFWFAYMAILIIYSFFNDKDVYRQLMIFIIIGYSIGLIMFAVYPSIQHLRVDMTNATTLSERLIQMIYTMDTSTNVFPSIHVIGSVGGMIIFRKTELLKNSTFWRTVNIICGISIAISTVFIKQHSIVDVSAGILITLALIDLTYLLMRRFFYNEEISHLVSNRIK